MNKILVIGGSVIDIFGYPHQKMIMNDSNPGYLSKSLGGVGRNIAENLKRLNLDVSLISVIGQDDFGKMIIDHSKSIGLELHPVYSNEQPTYICLMDENNEDLISLAAMDQNKLLTIDKLMEYDDLIKSSDIIILDTNYESEVYEYIFNHYQKTFYVDAISSQKVLKIKPFLSKITTIKLNILEASILTNIEYKELDSLKEMGSFLLSHQLKEVYITLGNKGAFYMNDRNYEFTKSALVDVTNSIGAGDAFFAGVIYGKIKNLNPLKMGVANSIINLKDEKAVSSNLDETILINTYKEIE